MHVLNESDMESVCETAAGWRLLLVFGRAVPHRGELNVERVIDCPGLSQSPLNSSLSAFLMGAKVFTLDKRGRHCKGLPLIRTNQSGGHGQLEQVS